MADYYGSSVTYASYNLRTHLIADVTTTDTTVTITYSVKAQLKADSSGSAGSVGTRFYYEITDGTHTYATSTTEKTYKLTTSWQDVETLKSNVTVTKNRTTSQSTIRISAKIYWRSSTGVHSDYTYTYTVPTLPTYSVTYDSNGGSAVSAQTKYLGVDLTLRTTRPTRSGYTFQKWNTKSDGSGLSYDPGDTYTTDAALVLYAQWKINSYTLTIDPNGGTWRGSSSIYTYTQNYNTTRSIAEPTRPGFKFVGWAEKGSGHLSKINQEDPSFNSSSGGVAVYNNSGGGTVVHTRQTSSISDTTTFGTYEILIESTSGTTSPGNGGFYQPTTSAANQKYMHVFVAKVPIGYNVMNAQNATGDGRTITWLTSRKGTGDYEIYAYQHNCGSTGTFSTFGHVYIETGTKPMSWNLAYSAMTNITNGFEDTYTYGAGSGRLTALWAPGVPTHINVNDTWKTGTLWVNINGTWKQPLEGWINVSGTWKRVK